MTEGKSHSTTPGIHLPSRKALPPFESLRAFDAVARLGGVRKAAQGLRRDHAVISRHLRAVEDWTGTKLIERTPTGTVLTEDGIHYHKHIAEAIDMIANATIELMKHNDDHLLYAWCMPGLAFQWLMVRLGEFENAHPDLEIELRPSDTMPDFDRHEADVDIRLIQNYGMPPQLSPCVQTVEVATPPTILVASPEYIENAPAIEKPEDLLGHQLIHENEFDAWAAWLTGHGVEGDINITGPRLWHAHLTLDAARRGRGIALTNMFVASDDIESGRLMEISGGKDHPFEPMPIGSYLFIARSDRWDARPVRYFREWLLNEIKSSQATLHI